MSEKTELQKNQDAAVEKRRCLLKLGVTATPLVLTLSSRSALACHCKSPSAGGSVTNASHRPGEAGGIDITNEVKTYSGWVTYLNNNWTMGGVGKNTRLKDVPTIGIKFFSSSLANTKVTSLPVGFERDILTAYLNLSSSPTARSNCLTLAQLADMADGSYIDTASGVSFTSKSQIQTYLATYGLLGY